MSSKRFESSRYPAGARVLEFSLGHARTAYATASAGLAASRGRVEFRRRRGCGRCGSVLLVERGEVDRASAEAAQAVSCDEDQDTRGAVPRQALVVNHRRPYV